MARRRLTPMLPGQGSLSDPHQTLTTGTAGSSGMRAAPIAQVAGQSAEAAALREMAQGIEIARNEGRMIVDIPLGDISPGFLMRDRIVLDREELEILKASIQAHGQRTPAEVAPLPASEKETQGNASNRCFGLISGWRRWSALSELYRETGDPRFASLRALIRQVEDGPDSYVAMIEENEVRVGLSYFERARVVAELTRRGVFPDQGTALRTLFATASRAKRSKIGSFVDLVDHLGDVLRFPAEIPERLGLAVVARLRAANEAERQEIRAAVARAEVINAKDEIAVLSLLVSPPKSRNVPGTSQESETLCPGVTLQVKQKGSALTLTVSGDAVDQSFIARLRAALRDV